jgi:hypothetical protein
LGVAEKKKSMPPILGTRGVEPSMLFLCCDCGDVTTGEDVIQGAFVHVVKRNVHDLGNSICGVSAARRISRIGNETNP